MIDDFAPCGSDQDKRRLNRIADRVFRAQGNLSGRGRMSADTSLRPRMFPRGLILSTGEDIPTGQSLGARMVVIEVSPQMIDPTRLAELQRFRGNRASVMSAYIRSLAPQIAARRRTHRDLVASQRHKFHQWHLRTPDIASARRHSVTIGLPSHHRLKSQYPGGRLFRSGL